MRQLRNFELIQTMTNSGIQTFTSYSINLYVLRLTFPRISTDGYIYNIENNPVLHLILDYEVVHATKFSGEPKSKQIFKIKKSIFFDNSLHQYLIVEHIFKW